MAAPPTFSTHYQNGTTCRIYRILAGNNLVQVGGVCGASNMESPLVYWGQADNRAVQFGKDIFNWQQNVIYKLVDGVWTAVYTVPNMSSSGGYGIHSGMYPIYKSGNLILTGYYYQSAAWLSAVEFDGTTWSHRSMGATAGGSYPQAVMTFRDLFFFFLTGIGYKSWDPSSGTVTHFATPSPAHSMDSAASCVFDGAVYLSEWDTGGGALSRPQVWRLESGVLVHQTNADPSWGVGPYLNGWQSYSRFCMIAFNDAIYVFWPGTNTPATPGSKPGIVVSKLTESGGVWTRANLTNTVVPIAWRAGGAYTVANYGFAVKVFLDNDTNPTSPKMHIWAGPEIFVPSGSWSYVGEWVDDSTLIDTTNAGLVGHYGHSMPYSSIGGGELIWMSGETNVEVKAREIGSGGQQYTLIAHGDPLVIAHGAVAGGPFLAGEPVTQTSPAASGTCVYAGTNEIHVGGVSGTFQDANTINGTTSGASAATTAVPTGGGADYIVKHYHSQEEEAPATQGTLTGAVSGGQATRNGNQIENVTADSVTEIAFTWDFQSDGYGIGERFSDMLAITPEP